MDESRRTKGARVTRKRTTLELDYELANALLNEFMRKVYQSAYDNIIGSGVMVAGLTVKQKDDIHNTMFTMLNTLKLSVPLSVLLGVSPAPQGLQKIILRRIFGSDSDDDRSNYFREVLGPDFARLAAVAGDLKVNLVNLEIIWLRSFYVIWMQQVRQTIWWNIT